MNEIEKKIKFELFGLSFLPMTLPYLANLFESVRIRIRNIEPKAYRTDTFSKFMLLGGGWN